MPASKPDSPAERAAREIRQKQFRIRWRDGRYMVNIPRFDGDWVLRVSDATAAIDDISRAYAERDARVLEALKKAHMYVPSGCVDDIVCAAISELEGK